MVGPNIRQIPPEHHDDAGGYHLRDAEDGCGNHHVQAGFQGLMAFFRSGGRSGLLSPGCHHQSCPYSFWVRWRICDR